YISFYIYRYRGHILQYIYRTTACGRGVFLYIEHFFIDVHLHYRALFYNSDRAQGLCRGLNGDIAQYFIGVVGCDADVVNFLLIDANAADAEGEAANACGFYDKSTIFIGKGAADNCGIATEQYYRGIWHRSLFTIDQPARKFAGLCLTG